MTSEFVEELKHKVARGIIKYHYRKFSLRLEHVTTKYFWLYYQSDNHSNDPQFSNGILIFINLDIHASQDDIHEHIEKIYREALSVYNHPLDFICCIQMSSKIYHDGFHKFLTKHNQEKLLSNMAWYIGYCSPEHKDVLIKLCLESIIYWNNLLK